MEPIYGKLREEDVPALKSVANFFKERGFRVGLHGTSLWNANYKDVDLIVVSESEISETEKFLQTLEELQENFGAKVLDKRGGPEVGLDYDLEIGRLMLHVSYVVFL